MKSREDGERTFSRSEEDSFDAILREAVRVPHEAPEHPLNRFGEGVELLAGRFVIERELGRGGMGVVYRAFDRERDRPVALKVIGTADAAGVHRFKTEFRALQHVAHPNLVRLHELFAADATWFFTMDLVEGAHFLEHVRSDTTASGTRTTLAAALAASRQRAQAEPPVGAAKPPREAALRLGLAQLAAGVQAIHRAGWLHRDLKPSNVLVTPRGQVVILDFGLVVDRRGEDADASEGFVGTPAYMAPEQIAGTATTASDWYAAGVMLYEALTGRLPFVGKDLVADRRKVPDPAAHGTAVPADLAALCRSLLEPDPGKRAGGEAILRALGMPEGLIEPLVSHRSETSSGNEPVAFVGRTSELFALREALAASEWGKLVVCRVRGPSGMGKTALVEEAFRASSTKGSTRVLSGRCHEHEAIPYKLLDGVIDGLGRELVLLPDSARPSPDGIRALARLFPALGRFARLSSGADGKSLTSDDAEVRKLAIDALREALSTLRTRGPVVLHVDDAQWADMDGALLLADAIAPPGPPLLLVVSYRSGEPNAALEALWRSPSIASAMVTDVAVGELTIDEVTTLVRHQLQGRTDLDVEVLAREASGVPLFAAEIARYALEKRAALPRTASGAGDDRPLTLDQAILARVALLPEDAHRVLEVAALAGVPIDRAFLASAAELADVDRAIAFLCAGNFARLRSVEGRELVESYHDRVREAVGAALTPEAARAVHGRIARALEREDSTDVERLADHCAAAGERTRAAGYAIRAAERAQAALAFDRAADWFGRALSLGDYDAGERRRLHARHGEALAQAGRGLEAAEALLRATHGDSDAKNPLAAGQTVELMRRAGEQLLMSGHLEPGLKVSEEVLAATGLHKTRTGLAAVLSLALGRLRVKARGLRYELRSESQIPPGKLAQVDAAWTIAASLGPVDFVRGAEFQVEHTILALDVGERKRLLRALALEIPFVAVSGANSKKKTERLLSIVDDLARDNDDPAIEGLLYLSQGMAIYLQGDLSRAIDLFCQGVDIHTRLCTGMSWEIVTAQRFIIVSLFFLGRLGRLATLLPPLLEDAEAKRNVYATMCFRSGYSTSAYLARDDVDLAVRQLARSRAEWSASAFSVPELLLLVAATHIDLYVGDSDAPLPRIRKAWAHLREAQLFRISVFSLQMLQLLGQSLVVAAEAAARRGQQGRARELLAEARRVTRRLANERIARAAPLSFLLEASVDWAENRPERARAKLLSAIQACDDQGLAGFGAAARVRLGEISRSGDEWIARGTADLRAEGIVRPERMVAMLAPGFGT